MRLHAIHSLSKLFWWFAVVFGTSSVFGYFYFVLRNSTLKPYTNIWRAQKLSSCFLSLTRLSYPFIVNLVQSNSMCSEVDHILRGFMCAPFTAFKCVACARPLYKAASHLSQKVTNINFRSSTMFLWDPFEWRTEICHFIIPQMLLSFFSCWLRSHSFHSQKWSQEAQQQRASLKLAHAENKLEQFIVILRDIFEYNFFFLLFRKNVKWETVERKKWYAVVWAEFVWNVTTRPMMKQLPLDILWQAFMIEGHLITYDDKHEVHAMIAW